MAKPLKRPALIHCKVTKTANSRAPWRVWFTTEENGKPRRVFKSYAREDEAWRAAAKKEMEVGNHGIRYGDIPPEVRRAFDFYRDEKAELEAEGATVPRFEDMVAAALADIRRVHAARLEAALPVAEGVEVFMDYKATRVGKRALSDLRDRLRRFAQDFGRRRLADITTVEIEAWLSSLRSRKHLDKLTQPPLLSALSRNHYRAAIHVFFAYAAAPARGWVGRNPVTDLEPERFKTPEPEAYSPEDAARLLQTALDLRPELVPHLALGCFVGLRTSEILQCDLGRLSDTDEELRVSSDGKTGARLAPYTAAAKAWLAAQPRRHGKAWEKCERSRDHAMKELFKLAEVEPIHNGLRHSFISYRVAEIRDVARVADECGNSVTTIKNHYRKLVTAEAAQRFFSIRPAKTAEHITHIQTGRAVA